MGVFESFMSSLAILIPILIIGIIILFIFFIIKNKEQNPEYSFSVHNLLKIYMYLMLIITMAAAAVGFAVTANSIFSYAFGNDFAYRYESYSEPVYYPESKYYATECYTGVPVEVDGAKYCFDQESVKKDFVSGLTLIVTMITLFSVHFFGLKALEKAESNSLLSKSYTFLSLIIYGIASVFAIPMSLYSLLNYIMFPTESLSDYSRQIPGQPLAITLVVTPIWIFFLYKAIALTNQKQTSLNVKPIVQENKKKTVKKRK